jgi:hypothetical protein
VTIDICVQLELVVKSVEGPFPAIEFRGGLRVDYFALYETELAKFFSKKVKKVPKRHPQTTRSHQQVIKPLGTYTDKTISTSTFFHPCCKTPCTQYMPVTAVERFFSRVVKWFEAD